MAMTTVGRGNGNGGLYVEPRGRISSNKMRID
jgi:hypothetical protein